jgi:P-type conjugative transfer protein TrbJ
MLGMMIAPLESPALFGAGDVVYDPANHVENIVTALQTGEMVLRQAEAIRNQLLMIENQVKNLAELDFSNIRGVSAALRGATRILGHTDGLTYSAGRIDRQFNGLYPAFGSSADSGKNFLRKVRGWNNQTRHAVRDAMRAQSIAERQEGTNLLIVGALGAAAGAAGNLQAQQAQSQMEGAKAAQLAQMQELMATADRHQASERAMDAAMIDAAIANSERWMRNFTVSTDVTPEAMPTLSY